MEDLQRAFDALNAKTTAYTNLWNYYDGDQPIVYSTERLEAVFRVLNAKFVQNWCAVVIDALLERLSLKGLTLKDQSASSILTELWAKQGLGLESVDVHTAAFVTGEAFLIAWPNEKGEIETYYNDPRLCTVFYDPERPKLIRFAAKWWNDEGDGKRHMTLYYPNRLEYYVSRDKGEDVQSWKNMRPAEPDQAPNPYGQVPVFHFRCQRRTTKSELANAVSIQDAVNKLLNDMMVAAEFGAFRQRWIIGNMEEIGQLKNAPNEIWQIPAGDGVGQGAQVGEFDAVDLGNYLNAIDKLATSIAVITRTPKHFFFGQGGDPSGEALIAMEAPLNKRAEHFMDVFGVTWRQVAAFMLKLKGQEVDPDQITPLFAEARTVQPLSEATTWREAVTAGLPLVTQLRREGWSQEELDQLEADLRAARRAITAANMQTALLEQQIGVSHQTVLQQFGFNADQERQQREAEGANLGEQLLSAFDQDQQGAAG